MIKIILMFFMCFILLLFPYSAFSCLSKEERPINVHSGSKRAKNKEALVDQKAQEPTSNYANSIKSQIDEILIPLNYKKLFLDSGSFENLDKNLKNWEGRFKAIFSTLKRIPWNIVPTSEDILFSNKNFEKNPSIEDFKKMYSCFQDNLIFMQILMSLEIRGEVEYIYINQSIIHTILDSFEKVVELNRIHYEKTEQNPDVNSKDLQKTNKELKSLDSDLKQIKEKFNQIIKDINNIDISFEQSKAMNKNLANFSEQLFDTIHYLHGINRGCLDEITSINNYKEALKNENIQAINNKYNLFHENRDLKIRNHELCLEYKRIQNQINNLKQEKENNQQKYNNLIQKKHTLQTENNKLKSQKTQQDKAYQKLQDLCQSLKSAAEKKDQALMKEKEALTQKLKKDQQNKISLKQKLETTQEKLIISEQKQRDFEKKLEEKDQEKTKETAQILELTRLLEEKDKELALLRQQNADLQSQLPSSTASTSDFREAKSGNNKFADLEKKIKLQKTQIQIQNDQIHHLMVSNQHYGNQLNLRIKGSNIIYHEPYIGPLGIHYSSSIPENHLNPPLQSWTNNSIASQYPTPPFLNIPPQ